MIILRKFKSSSCAAFVSLFVLSLAACVDKRREYYENGRLKQEVQYRQGKVHGFVSQYNEEGARTYEGTYEYGKPVGQHKAYHFNGKLSDEVSFLDGQIDGERKFFDPAGKLRLRATYTAGKLNDDCVEYDTKGNPSPSLSCPFNNLPTF
jgi:antitoxin component YwqK of YwqJK toxin-antitoxin module